MVDWDTYNVWLFLLVQSELATYETNQTFQPFVEENVFPQNDALPSYERQVCLDMVYCRIQGIINDKNIKACQFQTGMEAN